MFRYAVRIELGDVPGHYVAQFIVKVCLVCFLGVGVPLTGKNTLPTNCVKPRPEATCPRKKVNKSETGSFPLRNVAVQSTIVACGTHRIVILYYPATPDTQLSCRAMLLEPENECQGHFVSRNDNRISPRLLSDGGFNPNHPGHPKHCPLAPARGLKLPMDPAPTCPGHGRGSPGRSRGLPGPGRSPAGRGVPA